MQGKKLYSEKLFKQFQLSDRVPEDNFYRRLKELLDLYGEELFKDFFKQILKQCIDKGMVAGRRQVMDSVAVKANASMDSLVEKEILDDASVYAERVNTMGIKQANKCIIMAAVAYNLKKLLKWKQQKVETMIMAIKKAEKCLSFYFSILLHHLQPPSRVNPIFLLN